MDERYKGHEPFENMNSLGIPVLRDKTSARDEAWEEFNRRFSDTPETPKVKLDKKRMLWDSYRHVYVSGRLIQMGYPEDTVYKLGLVREIPQTDATGRPVPPVPQRKPDGLGPGRGGGGSAGPVHVRAYEREGGREHVRAHDRSHPGG